MAFLLYAVMTVGSILLFFLFDTPVVGVLAVVLSTLFEGFVWSLYTVTGFALVLLGNVLVLTPFERIKLLLQRRRTQPLSL